MRRKKENKALNVHCSTQQLIVGYVVKTLNAPEGGLKDKERENTSSATKPDDSTPSLCAHFFPLGTRRYMYVEGPPSLVPRRWLGTRLRLLHIAQYYTQESRLRKRIAYSMYYYGRQNSHTSVL